jgi:hypothetical protein
MFKTYKLLNLMAQRGMLKSQLATDVGLGWGTIQRLAGGEIRQVDAVTWTRLRTYFGVEKIEDLFVLDEVRK